MEDSVQLTLVVLKRLTLKCLDGNVDLFWDKVRDELALMVEEDNDPFDVDEDYMLKMIRQVINY